MLGEVFADPIRIAILRDFHELRFSVEPTAESEMLDLDTEEQAKRIMNRGKAWSFERECECELFHDARQIADFILDMDIKKPMPASLGITYLVVMFLVDVSITTGKAYVIMTGYLQSSKQLSVSALRQWFPEKEGINLSIVKGRLCGNFAYESDMKKGPPWMIYNVIGEIRLNNSGKRQVILYNTFRQNLIILSTRRRGPEGGGGGRVLVLLRRKGKKEFNF